jgi:CubicO group peptidase (beta-lactamase class C family)
MRGERTNIIAPLSHRCFSHRSYTIREELMTDEQLYEFEKIGRARNPEARLRSMPSLSFMLALALLLLPANALPALGQGLPPNQPERLGFDVERLARIDRVMHQYVDEGRVAGIVTMVLRHGRVAHAGAFGWADREADRRMMTDALFRIASQSKAVTSVAAMTLVEEGRLRLRDPVSKFLPGFAATTVAAATDTGAAPVPARRAINIRDLLTQSAGISYGTESRVAEPYRLAGLGPAAGYGWYFADKSEPICDSMDRLATLPFLAQPGERFVYGYATDILGCVIERVSGQTLAAFFESRIFEPLGMGDTHFFVPEGDRFRLTAVYAATRDGGIERAAEGPRGQGSYLDGPRVSFSGGAGLVSTAADYAQFLQMLLNGGVLDGARILGPKTVALMAQDHLDALYGSPGYGFGLGFQVLEDPGLTGQYGSPGLYSWGGAYASTYWVDPEEEIVGVFMIQLLPSGGLDLADRFRTLVYQAIVCEGATPC